MIPRIAILIALALWTGSSARAKTLYVDGALADNCADTYDVARRDCSGTDGLAFRDLDSFHAMYEAAVDAGDTIILRPGYYWGQASGRGLWLDRSAEGSALQPTRVTTLPGEERMAVLCADARTCGTYNPSPGECGSAAALGNSYYPEAALSIMGSYMQVSNLKTYGQVKITSPQSSAPLRGVVVEGCDLGGGGPSVGVASSQGMVVAVKNVQDLTIRNNLIHHSTCGDAPHNGAAILGYNFHALIENNEFRDYYDAAVFVKDTGEIEGQEDRTFTVRYNFMHGPSLGGRSAGVRGQNQNVRVGLLEIYENVIVEREEGVRFLLSGAQATLVRNNTFVNSSGYDVGDQANLPVKAGRAYNNFHYNSLGPALAYQFFHTWTPDDVEADFNCYWTIDSGAQGWELAGVTHTDLDSWIGVEGFHDYRAAAAFVNADCVDQGRCRPQDFVRKRRPEKMDGSPYGIHCGAYAESGVSIGIDWTPSGDCDDGADNDGDGQTDLADPGCDDPWDVSESRCGDDRREPAAELCDGVDLGGRTCVEQGFSAGTLGCHAGCVSFDTSACVP